MLSMTVVTPSEEGATDIFPLGCHFDTFYNCHMTLTYVYIYGN
jgi:hypothetical protein